MKKILTAMLLALMLTTVITVPITTAASAEWAEKVTVSFDHLIHFGKYYSYYDFAEGDDPDSISKKGLVVYLDDESNELEVYFDLSVETITFNKNEIDIWDVINEISPMQPFNVGRKGTIILSDPDQNGVYQNVEAIVPYNYIVQSVEEDGMIWVAGNTLIYTRPSAFMTMDGEPLQIENIKEGDVWEVLYIPYNLEVNVYRFYIKQFLTEKIVGKVEDSDYSPKSWYKTPSSSWETPENSFLINGNWYDLSYRPYMPRSITSGSSGIFYFDEYGKIAAFFPDVDVVKIYRTKDKKWVVTSALVKDNEPRVLIVALYGDDDVLKGIQTAYGSGNTYDGYKDISSIYTQVVDGDYIKAFIWEGLTSMKLVSPAERFDCKE